jgi:spectinomycin phosphotransferase
MLLPLQDLDKQALLKMLEAEFDAVGRDLTFCPLGEDSWSYRFGDLWVSVRRDLRGHCPAAYEAATLLRESGYDFVLAPLRGSDGEVCHSVGGRPVVVYPYVPAEPLSAVGTDVDIRDVIRLMDRIHRAAPQLSLPEETFRLSFHGDLLQALSRAESDAADGGPFGSRVCRLLRLHRRRIEDALAQWQETAAACTAAEDSFVLTHGEPSAPNILLYEGRLLFADWGAAMRGPAERDWFHFRRTLGSAPDGRPLFFRFYELRWFLSEVTEYAVRFLGEHQGDDEDVAMWGKLRHYLPQRDRIPIR